MVIEIAARDTRDDWFNIPELLENYNLIRDAARRRNQNDATAAFEVFRIRAQTCNDLIPNHATKLVKKVEDELKAWFQPTTTATFTGREFPEFPEIKLF